MKKLFSMGMGLGLALTMQAISSQPLIPSPAASQQNVTTVLSHSFRPTLFSANAPGFKVAKNNEFEVPFYDDFQDGDNVLANYTFVDVNKDGYDSGGYTYNRWYWKEDEKLIQLCVADGQQADDWLFTPALHLKCENMYNLEFVVNMGAYSDIEVTIGKSTQPEDQQTLMVLNELYDSWMTAYNTDFSVEDEGIYYIGFHQISNGDSWYFNLFSIDIKAGASATTPEAPSGLSAKTEKDELKAILTFTVPEKLANGKPLPNPTQINITRNNRQAAEIYAEPGSVATWIDDNPAEGENLYSVAAIYEGTLGVSADTKIWVGEDIPSAVTLTSFKAINGNMNVKLEWDAPTSGIHNGYINPESLRYTVWRGYNSDSMEPIADSLSETTFTDTQIAELVEEHQDGYFYGVSAYNATGDGTATAHIIAVGKPYTIPEHESFADGKFNIEPWLTDPISGSFSWSCLKRDTDFGMTSQDNDNGFSRFYSYWGGETDSRLKSPVFTLQGTTDPTFGVWMFHWEESSVAADYGMTKMIVEVSVNGEPFQPIAEPLPAGYHTYGWVEHRFSLAEFKEAETIQFGLRGITDNNWMYFYIDNITIEEMQAYDLAITDFYGTASTPINTKGAYRVNYLNRGKEIAEGYTVELYRNGVLLSSRQGEPLEPSANGYADFNVEYNATDAGNISDLYAKIVFDKDENPLNNNSQSIVTAIEESAYPTVTNLTAQLTAEKSVLLSWNAPELPTANDPIVDGAEDLPSFAIDNFGSWVTIDNDHSLSGYYTDMPEWPNRGVDQAFQVWAPDEISGFTSENYPDVYYRFQPYEGNKCFISWLAILSDGWDDPFNDDYLVSPEVSAGTPVNFMIKSIDSVSEAETYEVMYSATGRDSSDFISIHNGVASSEWTEVSVSLPEDARYFAIHYTGVYQMGIMIDNISYVPVTGSLKLLGYDVFKNGLKLNENPVAEATFNDSIAEDEEGVAYQVAAVYDRGSSNACEKVSPTLTGTPEVKKGTECTVSTCMGGVIIKSTGPVNVAIFNIDGRIILDKVVNGETMQPLKPGVYILKTPYGSSKIII